MARQQVNLDGVQDDGIEGAVPDDCEHNGWSMKYLNHKDLGIVIFSPAVTHAQMAARLGGQVASAGFVDVESQKCFGESVSLNLKSREEDTLLLRASASV